MLRLFETSSTCNIICKLIVHLHHGEFDVFGLLIIFRRWLRSDVNIQLFQGVQKQQKFSMQLYYCQEALVSL